MRNSVLDFTRPINLTEFMMRKGGDYPARCKFSCNSIVQLDAAQAQPSIYRGEKLGISFRRLPSHF
jgi:hypothetical protein